MNLEKVIIHIFIKEHTSAPDVARFYFTDSKTREKLLDTFMLYMLKRAVRQRVLKPEHYSFNEEYQTWIFEYTPMQQVDWEDYLDLPVIPGKVYIWGVIEDLKKLVIEKDY